jgi:intracellular sulfur oxidation DsrE/DsrF family protein
MKNLMSKILMSLVGASLLAGVASSAVAGDKMHKLVIQVSSGDAKTQMIALNNAVNIQKLYGMDNIKIEIVAYGPGLGLLTANAKNKQATRVKSLALQNITFSACGNTMKKIEKKTGHKPKLVEGVGVVKGGVARIIALQEDGYSYIRP